MRYIICLQIQSRKGLIPADFVSELHILCEPKHIVKVRSMVCSTYYAYHLKLQGHTCAVTVQLIAMLMN